jgi:putative acetyltransferase
MDMYIRTARADDRERLLEVWERSVRATHQFLEDTDVIALRPLVAEELASDAIAWWVLASPADEPLGFLGYANDTVEALFIDPDCRGKGGGRLLVEQAQRLSTGTLTVDVNEQNESALRFYEALGFAVVDRSPTDSAGRPFPILHMKRTVPAALFQN